MKIYRPMSTLDLCISRVEFAEKQKQIQDKETMRRRMKENAPIWKRPKWKLFGVVLDLKT